MAFTQTQIHVYIRIRKGSFWQTHWFILQYIYRRIRTTVDINVEMRMESRVAPKQTAIIRDPFLFKRTFLA